MVPNSPRVLVVDDELPLVELVASYLQREGFTVLTATDGLSALALARQEVPDLVILDLMLPGIDGLEVCRQLRQFSDAYVIMLTARADEVDRIVGLTVGADDYVTKPFSPRELMARVRALLRRPRSLMGAEESTTRMDRFGELDVDYGAHEVRHRGQLVTLTPNEFQLLATLASRPGQAFTREQLMEQVWGSDFFGDEHLVDVHLSNLRRKLEDEPAHPRYIETVRGIGYRFRRPKS